MSDLSQRLAPIGARWRALPGLVRQMVWAALAGAAALVIFLMGFESAHHQTGPYSFITQVERKIMRPFRPAGEPALASTRIATNLVTLESDVGIVPTGLPSGGGRLYEHGGGMTSLGEDVLLLTYTGEIFAARSGTDIRSSGVFAPDNGRAAYIAHADAHEGEGYNYHRGYLRYNDLLFINVEGGSRGLVASYSEFHADEACVTNTLAFLPLGPGVDTIEEVSAGPQDWSVFYRTAPCIGPKDKHLAFEGQMASGRLAFEAPSTLYLTSGDYHMDGMRGGDHPLSQDEAADYGKVIAIDLQTGAARHVSSGHRNMQGIDFGADGALYVAEHGPRGGDELNRIVEGANYGWPVVSLGTAYTAMPLPEQTVETVGRHDGYEPPVMAWVPSVAVSGLTRVAGLHPAWEGDFLVSSLNGRSLYRIRMQEGRALYSEEIAIGRRIRDLHQHTDGRIVLWTDNQELVFLTAQDLSSPAEALGAYIAAMDAPARVRDGFEAAMGRCMECHALTEGDHTNAPSLARIHGDQIASTDFAYYSDALSSMSGTWSDERLDAFLADPQAVAPGTAMPAMDSNDPAVRAAVIAYLRDLDAQF